MSEKLFWEFKRSGKLIRYEATDINSSHKSAQDEIVRLRTALSKSQKEAKANKVRTERLREELDQLIGWASTHGLSGWAEGRYRDALKVKSDDEVLEGDI